jgi:hypothetical protein
MLRGPDAASMLTPLYELLGPNGANWVVVIVSGLIFVALAAILPGIANRWRDKDGPPLL